LHKTAAPNALSLYFQILEISEDVARRPEGFMRQDHHASSKAVVAALLLAISNPAMAGTLSGAGSTFVAPVMESWAGDYSKNGSDKITYQAVGSGKGIQAIEAGTVDFGASDKPLSPAELKQYGLF